MSVKTIEQIAKNIKAARQAAGLTQAELAAKCGLSTNYISRIERSDVSITVDTLEKLCKTLKIPSDKVLPF